MTADTVAYLMANLVGLLLFGFVSIVTAFGLSLLIQAIWRKLTGKGGKIDREAKP